MLVQVLTFSYPAIPTEPPKEGHRGPFDDYNPTVVRPRRITTISLSTLHARNPTYDVRRNGALLVLPDPARQRHVTVLARRYEVERFHLRMRYESGAGGAARLRSMTSRPPPRSIDWKRSSRRVSRMSAAPSRR